MEVHNHHIAGFVAAVKPIRYCLYVETDEDFQHVRVMYSLQIHQNDTFKC